MARPLLAMAAHTEKPPPSCWRCAGSLCWPPWESLQCSNYGISVGGTEGAVSPLTDPEARPHNSMQKEVRSSSQVKRPLQSSATERSELWAQGNQMTGIPAFSSPNAQSTYLHLLHPGPFSTSTQLGHQPLFNLETLLCLCFCLPYLLASSPLLALAQFPLPFIQCLILTVFF